MTTRDQADTRTGPAAPSATGEQDADLDQADPRLARSRARLLDAATHLLATGGIDAVTHRRGHPHLESRAHHPLPAPGSSTHLLAATFERLPHAWTPPDDGPCKEQLIALLTAQADLIENAPSS